MAVNNAHWRSLQQFLEKRGVDARVSDNTDVFYDTADFNAYSFPKRNIWTDALGRHYVVAGRDGVWEVKLPRERDMLWFPDVRERVALRTRKHPDLELLVEVVFFSQQNSATVGREISSVVARLQLRLLRVTYS